MNAPHKILCAPLEQILVSGGDTRTAIDAQTGLNSFGCSPYPRPETFSFGSSTASSISQRAFCHLESERGKLLRLSSLNDIDAQTERQRRELKHLLGLSQSVAEIIFSPSGTDATLHALALARALYGQTPIDSIVLASDETGSGVPHALSGLHFNTMTAEGVCVTKGGPIAGMAEEVTLVSLPMRSQEGVLHTPARMEQEIIAAVARSVAAGHRVLLQVMDSSKLGVRCPSSGCLQYIQSQFADAVMIVVDACQMRLSLARLNWHLAQNHLVLISGSKFFTGPPFSGALLVPALLSSQFETIRNVPPGLQDYTGRIAWPQAWRGIRAALPARVNWGQHFRWAAAIEEMRAYFAIPLDFRRAALQQFAAMTTALLESHPDLLLLEDCAQSADSIEDAEMGVRTIFPFLLRHGKEWMSYEDATQLYGVLNENLTSLLPVTLSPREQMIASKICHIGQPVRISTQDRMQTGALRICASARTVSAIWSRNQRNVSPIDLKQECNELATILDKMALACSHFALLKK